MVPVSCGSKAKAVGVRVSAGAVPLPVQLYDLGGLPAGTDGERAGAIARSRRFEDNVDVTLLTAWDSGGASVGLRKIAGDGN